MNFYVRTGTNDAIAVTLVDASGDPVALDGTVVLRAKRRYFAAIDFPGTIAANQNTNPGEVSFPDIGLHPVSGLPMTPGEYDVEYRYTDADDNLSVFPVNTGPYDDPIWDFLVIQESLDVMGSDDDGTTQYLSKTEADELYQPIGDTTDHGGLSGLGDDDHPHYLNTARGDARYALAAHSHSGVYSAVGHGHVAADISDFAATVRATALTGLGAGSNTAIAATDTILGAFAKLQNQISNFGGMAIGSAIGNSPTAGSVLFVGAGGVLAQNNAALKWDDAIHGLAMGDPAVVTYPYWLIARGSGGTSFAGYSDVNFILRSAFGGAYVQVAKSLYFGDVSNSHAILNTSSNSITDPTLTVLAINAGKSPLCLKLASSQTAGAMEVRDSADNVWFKIEPPAYGAGVRMRGNYGADGVVLNEMGLALNDTGYGAQFTIVTNYANVGPRLYGNSRPLMLAYNAGTYSAEFDGDTTGGNTRLKVFDVDNNQLERVSVGAADSGGVGYKVLRIPN